MFQTWLHDNFFKVIVLLIFTIFLSIFYINHKDDFKQWLHKTDVIKASEKQPIFILPNGNASNTGSGTPILVNVTPQAQEKTSVAVIPKTSKDSPDVILKDDGKYIFEYNGKKHEIAPVVKEEYKFQKNGMDITKSSVYTIKVETEKPRFAVGAGYSFTQNTPVGLLEMRLDKKGYTSLWIVGGKDVAISGIKFNF